MFDSRCLDLHVCVSITVIKINPAATVCCLSHVSSFPPVFRPHASTSWHLSQTSTCPWIVFFPLPNSVTFLSAWQIKKKDLAPPSWYYSALPFFFFHSFRSQNGRKKKTSAQVDKQTSRQHPFLAVKWQWCRPLQSDKVQLVIRWRVDEMTKVCMCACVRVAVSSSVVSSCYYLSAVKLVKLMSSVRWKLCVWRLMVTIATEFASSGSRLEGATGLHLLVTMSACWCLFVCLYLSWECQGDGTKWVGVVPCLAPPTPLELHSQLQ